jgi:hypothetical protein
LSHLIEDRTDNVLSYPQLLQHLKDRVSWFYGGMG